MPASTTSPAVPSAFQTYTWEDWEQLSKWLARRMRAQAIPLRTRLAILADLHAVEQEAAIH